MREYYTSISFDGAKLEAIDHDTKTMLGYVEGIDEKSQAALVKELKKHNWHLKNLLEGADNK